MLKDITPTPWALPLHFTVHAILAERVSARPSLNLSPPVLLNNCICLNPHDQSARPPNWILPDSVYVRNDNKSWLLHKTSLPEIGMNPNRYQDRNRHIKNIVSIPIAISTLKKRRHSSPTQSLSILTRLRKTRQ